MTLGELKRRLPETRLIGDPDTVVTGLSHDSRAVPRGGLFCALKGEKTDGNRFISGALDRGAAAVLTHSLDGVPEGVPVLLAEDARSAMALAAHALHGDPTRDMVTVGLTGTNGKTTCTYIVQSIANAAGLPCGRIGTTGWDFAGEGQPLERTTPEAPDLVGLIAGMRDKGAKAVVMEVTSIALPMRRVDGFRWDGVQFGNLSQDHMDLHGSMPAYADAKKELFRMATADTVAVSNADDPYGRMMIDDTRARTITYGFNADDVDVRGEIIREDASGIAIRLSGQFGELELDTPYIGRFNASNVLACATLALGLGWSREAVVEGVRAAPQVRGRMERLALEGDVTAVIDYAHTPDALQRALEALRPMTAGRLIVVIGAGGDRDSSKRPVMGRIASEGADIAVITSDNPRTEDPDEIVWQVMTGAGDNATAVVDRRAAIKHALEIAQPADIVAVCGKGHETYQEIHGVKHPFDDREEVLAVRGRAAC